MRTRFFPAAFAALIISTCFALPARASEAAISISDASVVETNIGETSIVVTISAAGANGRDVSVAYATVAQSASEGSDFTASSGRVTLDKRNSSATVTVPVKGDQLFEPDETFLVVLSSPSIGATILDGEAVATILNDDPLPSVSIADGSGLEGEPTLPGSASFDLVLSSPSGSAVSVDYQVGFGTAGAADLNASSGSASIPAGGLVTTIAIPLIGDQLDESDETFKVTLGNASGATITDGQAAGTILDDDPEPTLAVADVAVAEGPGWTTKAMRFTVSLSGASGKAVSVSYATLAGSAAAGWGGDFTAASGTLTFPAGTTSRTVDVTISGDSTYEPDENLFLDLSSPVDARIADGRAEGRILNDDPIPAIYVDDDSVAESQYFQESLNFDVFLSNPSYQTVSVSFTTRNGTAVSPDDYWASSDTFYLYPGQTGASTSLRVIDDSQEEQTEEMYIDLFAPRGGTIGDGTGVGTIYDNEGLSIGPYDSSNVEGDTIVKEVTLAGSYVNVVSVDYQLSDYFSGDRYTCVGCSGKLVFLPGESSKTISYQVPDNNVCDGFRVIQFTLSNPVNARLNINRAVAGVYDPDCW